MKESVFRFKRFNVRNERSALKVGTDGVLLGAAATIPPGCKRVLDIGTGTGLIALMIAQRTESMDAVEITGIDIDEAASIEASENFAASGWSSRLKAENAALQEYGSDESESWDLIISNPPFFENSLKAPSEQRSNARHTDTLSYRDIIVFASIHLSAEGLLSMILPSDNRMQAVRYAASFGLKASRILEIRTTAGKEPKRVILEFQAQAKENEIGRLTMMSDGRYTEEFKTLTGDFYLDRD